MYYLLQLDNDFIFIYDFIVNLIVIQLIFFYLHIQSSYYCRRYVFICPLSCLDFYFLLDFYSISAIEEYFFLYFQEQLVIHLSLIKFEYSFAVNLADYLIFYKSFFFEKNLINQQYQYYFHQCYYHLWRYPNERNYVCATMSLMIFLLTSSAFTSFKLVPKSDAAPQIQYDFYCIRITFIF